MVTNLPAGTRPKMVLICHAEDALDREGLARWLATFTDLAGVVVIHEPASRLRRRMLRELRRVGWLRFLDVLAFRLFYRLSLATLDGLWREKTLAALQRIYPPVPASCRILHTPSPNSPEAEVFLRELAPEFALARCKSLLAERIFSIPRLATLVFHPGVCPEYRNAHGCFWALVRRDLTKVGMTLLAIDRGIDTGPVYAHYSYPFEERSESHIVIQYRVVLENLDALAAKILEISAGHAAPLNTAGRSSAEWGQPWLTAYLRWRQALS